MVQQEFCNTAGDFPRSRHKTSEQLFPTQLYRLMHPANNEIQLKAQPHILTLELGANGNSQDFLFFFHMNKVHFPIPHAHINLSDSSETPRAWHPAVIPRVTHTWKIEVCQDHIGQEAMHVKVYPPILHTVCNDRLDWAQGQHTGFVYFPPAK